MTIEILWTCASAIGGFIIGAVAYYFFCSRREEEYELDTEFLAQCYTNFINAFLIELLANYELLTKDKVKTEPLGESFYRVVVSLTGAEVIVEFDMRGGKVKVIYIVENAENDNCSVYEKTFKYKNCTTNFLKVRKFGDKMFNLVADNQLAKHDIEEDEDGNLTLKMLDGSVVKVDSETGEILNRDECDKNFLELYDKTKKVFEDNHKEN